MSTQLSTRVDEHLAELAGQRMIFLVSHRDRRQSAVAAAGFADALNESQLFAGVQGRVGKQQTANWRRTFFPHRFNLLSREARQTLAMADIDQQHPLLQQALARLYSPMASAVAPNLLDDPLQLFFTWQLDAAPKSPFSAENGWLTREYGDRVYRLISVSLAGDPYDLDYQQAINLALDRAQSGLPAGAQLLSSGLLIHAAHGAAQARQEISTIGLGSLLGIGLLLIYCFRRARFLLLAFLPIATGWLFALAICISLFDSLHLVTLVFGASLIGVAIDYSLHYLCAYSAGSAAINTDNNRHHGKAALIRIMPGISLGLLSSALAYAAQGAAPFPGLRQMAVFSVCGLLGAWLTVVLWLPHLSPRQPRLDTPIHRLAALLARLLARWPNVASARVAIVLATLAVLGLYQLSQLDFNDDVRQLQTSPQALLQEDAQVQSLTRAVDPSHYFVVSAADEQALLEREEKLHGALDELVDTDQLYDFQAISKWVPSFATQEQNRALNQRVVHTREGLATMLTRAIGSPNLAEQMQARFAENPGDKLTITDWLASEAGHSQRFLWLGEFEQQVHSLVLVAGIGDEPTLGQLASLAGDDDQIYFVDKVEAISSLLEGHRRQLQIWIGMAYGAVLALLAWRYGRVAWRIMAAPAIASVLSLAILDWGGFTVNIFNLLALLLVLGIGLDAGIFLWESRLGESENHQGDPAESTGGEGNQASYTWAAVTMAAITTLLAFGLLSLSATPVLHQFGITVLLGIVGVWCLAPCFIKTICEDGTSPAKLVATVASE
ncbi:MAG: MMPL family transporter [Cellvibrionaceae bacterium]